jgi:hypothetical protein
VEGLGLEAVGVAPPLLGPLVGGKVIALSSQILIEPVVATGVLACAKP